MLGKELIVIKKLNILFVRKVIVEEAHHINTELQLVKALNSRGHNAKLMGIGKRTISNGELVLLKFSMNKGRIFLLKLLLLLPFYCITKNIDVLIVDSEIVPSTFFVVLIKRIFSIKILLDVRSIPVERDLPATYKHACNIACKYYNGTTFITNGTKKYIEQLINKRFKNTLVFPSAVNPSVFSPAATGAVPLAVKEKLENKIILFYHGSISPNRGVFLVLDALHQIKEQVPNILFVSLSGSNNFITEYCISKNYKLDDHLLLLNLVDHESVPAYIKEADICIVPLPRLVWWEISSPLKLMEYLAMEKPLILSDIEAHKSVVPADSGYALYFNPDEPEDLGKAILKAIGGLNKLRLNAVKGRELIFNKFTWEIQAKAIEEFAGYI